MYPKPFIDYLIQFHCERDYFECHEILEEYWKEDSSIERHVWVIFIQYAVGLYHHRIHNFKGAQKMIASAQKKIPTYHLKIIELGINPVALNKDFNQLLNTLEHQKPYTGPTLPIQDENLAEYLLFSSHLQGKPFIQQSDLTNLALIYRHTLRDRTDVIQARLDALHKRNP